MSVVDKKKLLEWVKSHDFDQFPDEDDCRVIGLGSIIYAIESGELDPEPEPNKVAVVHQVKAETLCCSCEKGRGIIGLTDGNHYFVKCNYCDRATTYFDTKSEAIYDWTENNPRADCEE